MKYIFAFTTVLVCSVYVFGQNLSSSRNNTNNFNTKEKQPIDFSSLSDWEYVGNPKICGDGSYVLYTSTRGAIDYLTISSTFNTWKKQINNVRLNSSSFTSNNKRIIYLNLKDSIGIVLLGSEHIDFISDVKSFKSFTARNDEWLAYLLKNPVNELVLRNMETNKELRFDSVINYDFNEHSKILLLQREITTDGYRKQVLETINIKDLSITKLWKGDKISNYCIDPSGKKIAFITEIKGNDGSQHELWYYDKDTAKAQLLIKSRLTDFPEKITLANSTPVISKDGDKIFFKLKQIEKLQILTDAADVDIWSYVDPKLQSQQLKELRNTSPQYTAVINLNNKRIIQLESEEDRILDELDKVKSNHILVLHRKGPSMEFNWNSASQPSIYLISLNDGSRRLQKDKIKNWTGYFSISMDGGYVINYDPTFRCYLSFNIKTGVTRNITNTIYENLASSECDQPGPCGPEGIAGWIEKNQSVLIYDNYDLWEVDLNGIKPPINVTNGYGKSHKIKFRLLTNDQLVFEPNEKLLMVAFNKNTKDNGFFCKSLGEKNNPELLTMGPFVYYWPYLEFGSGLKPIKAKEINKWIVSRKSATNATNYFITTDFKNFDPISNICPQTRNIWLNAELVKWKTEKGKLSEGILYKPENFNPQKKYPIIFNLYEKFSDNLNCFLNPGFSGGPINIAYFVSNGYLIFAPDIHYTIGEPGESAYDYVLSAAKYLSKKTFIDSTKMAVYGHSFGGYEVNYLVTHTNIFAAAVSAAGVSNFISAYGGLRGNGESIQRIFELTQCRMGTTLWDNPSLYIKNSPIFRADKITTPLLLMNNKNDQAVPFGQGVEFFTALRRLNKKAWLLQYDDGDHIIVHKAARDFTIRLKQFLDYYLKGISAPVWMTKGVPARLKKYDDGLNYY